jgi:Putative auto-transporter adhesin, head GIN domain
MRNAIKLVFSTGIALVLGGCGAFMVPDTGVGGSGNVKSESRDVSGFDEVFLAGIGDLSIQQTGTESLTVEAEDNLLPLITTQVAGGRLTIGVKPGTNIRPTRPIRYQLTVKQLSTIGLSGAGTVSASNLTAGAMTVTTSGAGKTSIAGLSATTLHVTLSGVGDVTISGQTQSQDVTLSGAGSYQARDLASNSASVRVSGTGSATVQVRDTLDAHVSGVGSVVYYGNPSVTKDVSGVGSVRQG